MWGRREAAKEDDTRPCKEAKPRGVCHGWTPPPSPTHKKKEGKEEDGDGSNNSGSEQVRLDLFCVFDHYFRDKDDVKSKGQLWVNSIALVFRTYQFLIVRRHV